jgi:hypothetical protein
MACSSSWEWTQASGTWESSPFSAARYVKVIEVNIVPEEVRTGGLGEQDSDEWQHNYKKDIIRPIETAHHPIAKWRNFRGGESRQKKAAAILQVGPLINIDAATVNDEPCERVPPTFDQLHKWSDITEIHNRVVYRMVEPFRVRVIEEELPCKTTSQSDRCRENTLTVADY